MQRTFLRASGLWLNADKSMAQHGPSLGLWRLLSLKVKSAPHAVPGHVFVHSRCILSRLLLTEDMPSPAFTVEEDAYVVREEVLAADGQAQERLVKLIESPIDVDQSAAKLLRYACFCKRSFNELSARR